MVKKAKKEPASEEMHPFEHFIKSFGRFCAWMLIVFIILYFISGFGMTKGIMDRAAAVKLHSYLTLPMAFAFIFHTLVAVRFALIRWDIHTEKNEKVLDYVFIAAGVVLFGLVCWVYFV